MGSSSSSRGSRSSEVAKVCARDVQNKEEREQAAIDQQTALVGRSPFHENGAITAEAE